MGSLGVLRLSKKEVVCITFGVLENTRQWGDMLGAS